MPALGRYFLEAIHPFVWRRSLDFGAIGEISSITRRIRDHYAQGQAFGPGYDVKRGRGGIREVEFFVQVHQLIHGGREPELRAPATLDALAALAKAGRIKAADAAALADAYRLLRTIEHRLQMVDDRQTHSLPVDLDELDNAGRLHGLADGAALLGLLGPHVERVAAIYDTLAASEGERLPENGQALERTLEAAGYAEPQAARARIEGWRSGKVRSLQDQRGARGVRGDAAGAGRCVRRGARSPQRPEPVRGPDPEAAQRGQFLPPARSAAGPGPASGGDLEPRAGARRAIGAPPAAARRPDRRQRLLAGRAGRRR